ncbi:sensor histidine kinase [Sporosarcina sp. 179-K 3D1 HS]|uniref:sensor histidine kinase n=1 Tax=Sporosarcina sp. 179-K 3D1 HS TaxID=3232169 RepID=UPI0039A3CA43
MILGYLNDRKSWLFFFAGSLLFTDILILIDKGLSVKPASLLYLNILLISTFIAFFAWRFKKETRFTRELGALLEESSQDWHTALPEPQFVQENRINELLEHVGEDTNRKIAEIKAATVMEHDYTAAWVHEVKAPLTAMKMTIDTQRQDRAMRKIEAEWLRIHLLIDRQLYISRLPTLSADYVLEKIGLRDLVTPEVRELRSWCVEKNIAVEFEGEQIEAVTDRKWCRFIIRQLLTNAVNYSPEGGTISISAETMPSGQARLIIQDEGPGIPVHDLPRIFDKGFTGSTGRLHNAATGLGLYLSRQVAEKIGIALTAQSDAKKGTALHLTFSTKNDFDTTRT